MRTLIYTGLIAAAATYEMSGATVMTTGSGSAVPAPDRIATFDDIQINDHLLNYVEDGVVISVNDTAWEGFKAFHNQIENDFFYGKWGNFEYVSIKTEDDLRITGLELLYGTGWGDNSAEFLWETWTDGTLSGTGTVINAVRGSVFGFLNNDGFDELRVGAGQGITKFGTVSQAIAIDNVKVNVEAQTLSFFSLRNSQSVPDASATLGLLAMGTGGLFALRRRFQR